MRKTRLVWSDLAKLDLRRLKARIARNAPKGAREYVRKLKATADNLRHVPEAGWVVEEIGALDIRELVYDRYRILYFFDGKVVSILRVWRGARPLDPRRLKSE